MRELTEETLPIPYLFSPAPQLMSTFTATDDPHGLTLPANDPLRLWFHDEFFNDMGITITTDEPNASSEAKLPTEDQSSPPQEEHVSAWHIIVHEHA